MRNAIFETEKKGLNDLKILLVNDDGIQSPGLAALGKALAQSHQVTVVAPDGNRSAVGHGITLDTPLLVRKVELLPQGEAYQISGSPVDCTRLGLDALCPQGVNLVISGINYGENVSSDLPYSGTVAAAVEASLLGVPGIAVSAPREAQPEHAAALFLRVLARLEEEGALTGILNINLPPLPSDQVTQAQIVPPSPQRRAEHYVRQDAPDGTSSYRLRSQDRILPPEECSDIACLQAGMVSITPLRPWQETDQPPWARKGKLIQLPG